MHRLTWIPPLLLVACSLSSLDGMQVPLEKRNENMVCFVKHQEKDGRGLDRAIASAMVARGFKATAERPETFDCLVTYEDRWAFDMRMYLLDLRIDVRDAKTNVLVGTARSFQTSLSAMGKTHESIIEDVVQILAEGPAAP